MTRLVLICVFSLSAAEARIDAAKPLKSGPQVGSDEILPFSPFHCSGASKGDAACLVCEHGTKPVVMIFARSWSPELTALVKKIDAVNQKQGDKMGSFVVVLDDGEAMKEQLAGIAAREKLQRTTLAVDGIAGPRGYRIPAKADVTIVTYVESVVKTNHALRKGELNDKTIDLVLSELPKILSR